MFRSAALTLALCLATITAQASLLGRAPLIPGGTDYRAYYDTTTNLTWVADANLASTSGYCNQVGHCTDASGHMNWARAQSWIHSLNIQNLNVGYLGANNWRLPELIDTGEPGCVASDPGGDCGYYSNGDMARLYYDTLGNIGPIDPNGIQVPCDEVAGCLTNKGPFINIQLDFSYVYGTQHPIFPCCDEFTWEFYPKIGKQDAFFKSYNYYYAWAVAPGDIAPVPVPATAWLLGTALAGLCGRRVMQRKVAA